MQDLKVGQQVNYENGASKYTGEVVEINNGNIVVIDDAAGMELWKAGFAVGDCIVAEQILNIL